jgi:Carboxypeptidase regulatory-like domain
MRTRSFGSLALLILLVGSLPATHTSQARQTTPASQQPSPGPVTPPRDAAAAADTGTARIRGRVIAAHSNKPVRGAQVRIFVNRTRATRLALTDGDGRYEFTELPPGRYSVSVTKAGYVSLGRRDVPSDGGKLFDLAEGQLADRTDFVLSRGAVIVGRITDESGEPLTGVVVQAMRFQYRPNGQRQLVSGNAASRTDFTTNDLGEFRIFGLIPGSYIVAAKANHAPIVTLERVEGFDVRGMAKNDGPATTYYPGTTNVTEAQPVTVALAAEASASFTLLSAQLTRLTGTVHNSAGHPATGAHVSIRSDEGTLGDAGMSGGSQVAADGSFSLANVAPGEYILEVRLAGLRTGATPAGPEFASVPVTVTGDGEPKVVAITTSLGATISGRVIFEGKRPPSTASLRIAAMSEELARNLVAGTGQDAGDIDSNGRFLINGVFGRVVFRPMNFPQPWLLKSVKLNGEEIADTLLDVTSATNLTDLEIVVTDRPAYLTGYAKDAAGKPVADYKVLVFPANLKESAVPIRYMHTSGPDATGKYQIGRMPSGDYIGIAVGGIGVGDEWDPELRKRVEPMAERFTLAEGQTLRLDLPFVQR